MNKYYSTSPKDALCKVWLKLIEWFWRRRILNVDFFLIFPLFHYYLPLESDEETSFPFTQECFVNYAIFEWNWPSGSEDENVKSYRQTDSQTTLDQKSSPVLSAYVRQKGMLAILTKHLIECAGKQRTKSILWKYIYDI